MDLSFIVFHLRSYMNSRDSQIIERVSLSSTSDQMLNLMDPGVQL